MVIYVCYDRGLKGFEKKKAKNLDEAFRLVDGFEKRAIEEGWREVPPTEFPCSWGLSTFIVFQEGREGTADFRFTKASLKNWEKKGETK